MTKVSIIIPIHNEGRNIYNTVKSIRQNTLEKDYEIIVVDDGSTDRNYENLVNFNVRFYGIKQIGLVRAKNYGVKHAKGKFFVFLDGHMTLHHRWLSKLIDVAEEFDPCITTPCIYDVNNPLNKGYGFTFASWVLDTRWLPKKCNNPYEIPMAGGACMVVSKKIFNLLGGFDPGIKQWGREDAEICLRSWLMGYPIILMPAVEVGHLFRSQFPYEVKDIMVYRNVLRFALTHFNSGRIKRVIDCLKKYPNFYKAYLANLLSDVLLRRYFLMKKRRFDDNWFFEKFNIDI